MTPAIGRLKKRTEFLAVASAGLKWVAPGLILQARQRLASREGGMGGEAADTIRVGYTASRKVGSAVERNRARRRLRAVVAEVMPGSGRPGYDYVLVARAATLARAYDDLKGDLRTALRRIPAEARAPRRRRSKHPERRPREGTNRA